METLYANEAGAKVGILTSEAEIEALLALFARVAEQEGWQPGNHLLAYLDRSVFLALQAGDAIAGGLQMVPGRDGEPLPCRALWPELEVPNSRQAAHVAVLAIRKEYRGSGRLFWLLCAELWRYCMAHGIADLYLEVTPGTLRLYERIGWPLRIVGDLRPHWGEPCYLCTMKVGDLADIFIARSRKSAAYRRVVLQGLHLPGGAD